LENGSLVVKLNTAIVTDDIVSIDVALVGGDEVDADGIVVEVTWAFRCILSDDLEAGVSDVECLTVTGEGNAVGLSK
jgi:hypothetical protein